MPSGFDQHQRQQRILEHVVSRDGVRIEHLAAMFGVSAMTIHRDLDALQRQGLLRKLRGGVTAEPTVQLAHDVRQRTQTMAVQKAAIAAASVERVQPGQAVVIDDSTTALHVAKLLPALAPLTVVTNLLAAIRLLAGTPGIDLIALGGTYHPGRDAFLGARTLESIRHLRADVLFMSTTAVTDHWCYLGSAEMVQIKLALMDVAADRILLVDHTKLERRALNQLCPLSAFDAVYVDSGVSPVTLEDLRQGGIPVTAVRTAAED